MSTTMKFRLIGKEFFTSNEILTGWTSLDISMSKLNEFYEWFSKIAYDINIEFKTEVLNEQTQ